MSLRRHPASRLSGWDGPLYPALTPQLAEALDGLPERERDLASIRSKVQGVAGFSQGVRPEPATDSYQWLAVLDFSVYNGRVLIAIPHWNDTSRIHGTTLDRAPAAYLRGQYTNVDTANVIMARVIRALRPERRRPILTGP